ncbi:aromatic ring-opening dioxygenase [Sphingomonas panacisoli]|uniref:Aromatic ring-opening dioxygenase n=1 Tax=Sphingomonas panacisoli TaxID=1813879 RepID=A0A5B8LI78_9SPHN|nr:aromatic ring-opening dioxygenase [Sphingomonas panacisoli]
MTDDNAPWHAHVYYDAGERPVAEELRGQFERMAADAPILFVGSMVDRPVGPHPIPQFEIHFPESARGEVTAAIEPTGLRALIHPLTDDDLADHTSLARWIGEPLDLDVTVLDPPGMNQGVARFGKSDF